MLILLSLSALVTLLSLIISAISNYLSKRYNNKLVDIAIFVTTFLATLAMLTVVNLPLLFSAGALIASITIECTYRYFAERKAKNSAPNPEPEVAFS